MIALIAAFGLAALVQTAEPPWTWTLYDGDGALVLANEVPDTPQLRATLECEPGSGAARLSLYGGTPAAGFGAAASGEASAAVEAGVSRTGALQAMLRTDHPVFAAFAATGELTLTVGDQRRRVQVEAAHLAKLRSFVARCGG
jgi:hypothetical protein